MIARVARATHSVFVGLEQPRLPFLDSHCRDRIVRFLQRLVVLCEFQLRVDLDQRHVSFASVDQTAKPSSRVPKGQSWTGFKALGTGQQRRRNETGHARSFPDVNPPVERFMKQYRQGLQVKTSIGFHEQILPGSVSARTSCFITPLSLVRPGQRLRRDCPGLV